MTNEEAIRILKEQRNRFMDEYVDFGGVNEAFSKAIALLKEQEAVSPHYTCLEYLVNGKVVEIYHPECPRCFENGLSLWDAEIGKGQAYCKRCGQAVKWDA